jgi:hypothetical protein
VTRETDQHKHTQNKFDKIIKEIRWKKDELQQMVLEQLHMYKQK